MGVGRWPMEGGQGAESSVGATKIFGGGGMGGGVGRWPMEGGRAPESSVGATKHELVPQLV